jgi:hypothetical protein
MSLHASRRSLSRQLLQDKPQTGWLVDVCFGELHSTTVPLANHEAFLLQSWSRDAPALPGLSPGVRLPAVITALSTDAPGHDPGGNGIRALTDQRARGHKLGSRRLSVLVEVGVLGCRTGTRQADEAVAGWR